MSYFVVSCHTLPYSVILCYFSSYFVISCHILLFLVIFCYFLSYFVISCHTERSEVSTNSKHILNFFGFFATLKMTRILGFSLSSKNSKRQNKPSLWALWIQGVAIHNFNLIFACGLSRHFYKRLALTDKTPRLKFAKFAMTADKTNSLKFFCKTAWIVGVKWKSASLFSRGIHKFKVC